MYVNVWMNSSFSFKSSWCNSSSYQNRPSQNSYSVTGNWINSAPKQKWRPLPFRLSLSFFHGPGTRNMHCLAPSVTNLLNFLSWWSGSGSCSSHSLTKWICKTIVGLYSSEDLTFHWKNNKLTSSTKLNWQYYFLYFFLTVILHVSNQNPIRVLILVADPDPTKLSEFKWIGILHTVYSLSLVFPMIQIMLLQ